MKQIVQQFYDAMFTYNNKWYYCFEIQTVNNYTTRSVQSIHENTKQQRTLSDILTTSFVLNQRRANEK